MARPDDTHETTERLINGVPESRYGMTCRHDKHVMVADPNDYSDYPATIFPTPYPCDQPECSPERITAELEEEAAAYEEARWAEYRLTLSAEWF